MSKSSRSDDLPIGSVRLRCGDGSALISSRGAELRAWSVAGHDLLWSPDPAVWDAVAPVLFPIVGWARNGVVRVDGRAYEMGVHGFAASRLFAIAQTGEASATLIDQADETTLQVYPFRYALELRYTLTGTSLSCHALVRNGGEKPIPYAFGLHPGFRWDPNDASSVLTFEETERDEAPIITPDGLFAAERRSIPLKGRAMSLSPDLLSREAVCFLDLKSRTVTFTSKLGQIRIEHENIPHLALWSRPPAPFLCLESWTGHGDPEGFTGDLFTKPSMRVLLPGASARHSVTYGFEAA